MRPSWLGWSWLPVTLLLGLAATFPVAAHAGPGDAGSDSLTLVGEFVDPVCLFQHGMRGVEQRACANVPGRVEQGMYFLDIRGRTLYSVIGNTHWQDPRAEFLAALGDTFAIRARVWRYRSSSALAVTQMWPWREQPPAAVRAWPWRWEWTVPVGCALWGAAWALLMTRVRRARGIAWDRSDGWRAVSLGVALLVVLVSLEGPIHDLSDHYLFSAHMVQHLLLAQLFPPLFLLGIPAWAWRAPRRGRLIRAWNLLGGAPVGFVLYTLVFSVWHLPIFYDLMMRAHPVHIAMHLMVMGSALLMWWPIVGGEAVEHPLSDGGKMLYLFALGLPMMAVAALLTFAARPLYEWYVLAPRAFGLSAAEDQRLGGLIMWVPGGLFFWGIMSIVFFRWSARESRDSSPIVLPTPTAGAPRP